MTVRDLHSHAMQSAEQEVRLAVAAGNPDDGGAVLLGGAERYGVALTWIVAQGPDETTGQVVSVPVWFLALTRESPIVGAPGLSYCQAVGSPAPDEAAVRRHARAGVGAIRALYRQQLAAATS
jgi:hypothetical protein